MALAAKGSSAALDLKKAMSRRVVGLYRKMCREAPVIVEQYQLEHTVRELRHATLLQFRKNGHVADPRLLEALLARGEMELQEARQQWKQKGHVEALLTPELPPSDALSSLAEFEKQFLEGSVDDFTLWRGHNAAEQEKILRKVKQQKMA